MKRFLTKVTSTRNPPTDSTYEIKPFISDTQISKSKITIVRDPKFNPTLLSPQSGILYYREYNK